MRWHVICCLWLMLLTLANCDKTLKAPALRRSVRLDEVADFADVIEPLQSQSDSSNEKDESRREAKSSIFKRQSYFENELNSDMLKHFDVGNQRDEIQTGEDQISKNVDEIGADENPSPKRDVPKKYSDLLDLKYYYARGLPLNKNHFKYPNLRKRNILRSSALESKSDQKKSSKFKRSAINILPIVSEQNPYMSRLADATNDAYLKMRNYAATLMVILTTPKPPTAAAEQGREDTAAAVFSTPSAPAKAKFFIANDKKNKYKFDRINNNNREVTVGPLKRKMYSNQNFRKFKPRTKLYEAYDINPSSIDDFSEKSKKGTSLYTENNRPLVSDSNLPEGITSQTNVNQLDNLYKSSSAGNLKMGSESPYSWEDNILEEVNVKVKKAARLSEGAESGLEREPPPKNDDHLNTTKSSENQLPLDIESKVVIGQTNNTEATSCTINKLPESEEDNCEETEEEEDEDCPSNQPANSACLDTFQKLNRTKRQVEKDAANSTHTVVKIQSSSEESRSKNIDSETECAKFYTIPSEQLKESMTKAIENVNVPEVKPEDFKKFKPNKPSNEYGETIETNETKLSQSVSLKVPSEAKVTTVSLHGSKTKVATPSAKLNNLKAVNSDQYTHSKSVVNAKAGVELKESKQFKAAFGAQTTRSQTPKSSHVKTSSTPSLTTETTQITPEKDQQTQNIKSSETVKSTNTSTSSQASGDNDTCVEEYMSDSNSTQMQEVRKLVDPSNYPPTHKHHKVKKDVSDIEDFNSKENDQLHRLRRDMYVVNELQALLNTVREETEQKYGHDTARRKEASRRRRRDAKNEYIGNFYNHQNSQYNGHYKNNLVNCRDDGGNKGKEKRFLFKKKKRKRKKSQTVWKHLFGAHDDNRFLNQNFPNSQYAIYPI